MKRQVEQDIWSWAKDFVEVPNEFHDFKFPVCPFARSARLKNQVNVTAYESGGARAFIQNAVDTVTKEKKYVVNIFALPAIYRWCWYLKRWTKSLNSQTIPNGYYVQWGTAITTKSRYPGWFKNQPYVLVAITDVEQMLSASASLMKTDYYKAWSIEHYKEVVDYRQKTYNKFKKCPFGFKK